MKENEKKEDEVGTNGSLLGLLPKGSSYSCIQMNGKEVFRFAVRVVPQSIELALAKAGLTSSNLDWLLLHQVLEKHQLVIKHKALEIHVFTESCKNDCRRTRGSSMQWRPG